VKAQFIMRNIILLFYCIWTGWSFNLLQAQVVKLPGGSGYAVPVEGSTEEDESLLFDPKTGLHNWTDPTQTISYYFLIRTKGELKVDIRMKSKTAGNQVALILAGHPFVLNVPQGKFQNVHAGSVQIKDTGFLRIDLKSMKAKGSIADVESILLSGKAAEDLRWNDKSRRNAASVHLLYELPDTLNAIAFFNQVTVPLKEDPLHSYFMACGFARGYFGMQVNSDQERRVIFSVWDAGNEAVDRNKVADSNKVLLRGKGEQVVAEDFGNEGTGGHSHWVYPWKAGETYSFYVTAMPDSATNATVYTGYFLVPEINKWKLIASFKSPRDAKYLHGLYSFVENFWGVNGQLHREAFFGNGYVKLDNGKWYELNKAKFSTDATGRAGDRLDFGGGVRENRFYLWNGGFRLPDAQYGQVLTRLPLNKEPSVDLYQNADTLFQAEKDKAAIISAIRSGKFDTTGSLQGMYYKILKEGTGKPVLVSDTVVARYKGTLLDGRLFDETKSDPATFPLKRLIKGWQIGLPLCRVGGAIRLIIPSALAYGIRDRGMKIPPNQVLVFDIEVLGTK